MLETKTLNIHNENGLIYFTFPKLDKTNGVKHIFSTRHGGVSSGIFATMSTRRSYGDSDENVMKNFQILCNAVNIDENDLVLSDQTHTSNIRIVTSSDRGKGYTKEQDYTDIDGLITNERNIALVTQYADCTPLLFFDPIKKVIATSHAGWRGTVKEIGRKTVSLMQKEFGSSPDDIIAAIGPSIGQCCYEVDDTVIRWIDMLTYLQKDKIYYKKPNGKYMLDLKETNRQILVYSGIKNENIDVADICTACNKDDMHSHRASHGQRGNLTAIIELK